MGLDVGCAGWISIKRGGMWVCLESFMRKLISFGINIPLGIY